METLWVAPETSLLGPSALGFYPQLPEFFWDFPFRSHQQQQTIWAVTQNPLLHSIMLVGW